ncbi:MAG TPA: hypothetical protein VFR22_15615 [Nocardioidaceae bacterium]|nr:hypothetical protein [Nocardioidaceae bacterium]
MHEYELFEYYPVSGYEINSAADKGKDGLKAIDDIQGDVNSKHKTALEAVEDDIEPYVGGATQRTDSQISNMQQTVMFADGALRMFALAVDDYNLNSGPAYNVTGTQQNPRSVSKLNTYYSSQVNNSFGLSYDDYKDGGSKASRDYGTDIANASGELKGTLQTEYGWLGGNLDDKATEVEGMLKRGPNANDLKEMYAAGALPSWAAAIYPYVDFSHVKVEELPYNIRNLTYDEQVKWFIDNPELGKLYVGALDPLAQQMLGEKLGQMAKDPGDVDSVDMREQYQQISVLLNAYGGNDGVAKGFFNKVSADDLNDIMNNITAATIEGNPNKYWLSARVGDVGAEHDALLSMQDQMGNGLALLLATGSSSGAIGAKYGEDFASQNPIYPAILLHYGDADNREYGGDFLAGVINGSKNVEQSSPASNDPYYEWWRSYNGFGKEYSFGDEHLHNPVTQALQTADNSVRSSQQLWLNDDATKYILSERDYDGDQEQTEKLIKMATIEQTNAADDETAKRASEVSANLIDVLGQDKPDDRYDDEMASVIAKYIADVDRGVTVHDDGGAGVYANTDDTNLLPPWLRGDDGLPKYGIKIDRDHLTSLLESLGDDDTAKSILGDATGKYNLARMAAGADDAASAGSWTPQADGDPFMHTTSSSSQLTGYMQDSLVNGDIDDAQERADEREKLAKFFTSPLGYLPTKGGPVGDFIVGEVEDQLIKHYVVGNDVQNNIDAGNDSFAHAREQTKLNSYYALVNYNAGHDGRDYDLGDLGSSWPTDGNGNPIPPGKLSADHVSGVLAAGESSSGYPQAIDTSVDQSYDNQTKQYGDR